MIALPFRGRGQSSMAVLFPLIRFHALARASKILRTMAPSLDTEMRVCLKIQSKIGNYK